MASSGGTPSLPAAGAPGPDSPPAGSRPAPPLSGRCRIDQLVPGKTMVRIGPGDHYHKVLRVSPNGPGELMDVTVATRRGEKTYSYLAPDLPVLWIDAEYANEITGESREPRATYVDTFGDQHWADPAGGR